VTRKYWVLPTIVLLFLALLSEIWGWEDTGSEPQYIYSPAGHRIEIHTLSRISVMEKWKWMVVYSPHPDDEIYGLGATMNYYRRMGFKILVVLLTHGEKSIARQKLCDSYGYCFSETEFGLLRTKEFRAAMISLGVYHVVYDLGDQKLEEKGIGEIISYYDREFDVVYHFVPAFEREFHLDHVATYMALKNIHVRGGKAVFGIYALFYPELKFRKGIVLNVGIQDLIAKRDAMYQYRYWNPTRERYSIAYLTHPEFWSFLYSKCEFEVILIIIDE
jgi:LmbE family N-acetylglucosaminyl deacetylase